AAFTGADLGAALGSVAGIFLGNFAFEQAGAKNRKGAGFVLLLRALIGATDNQAGWLMDDLDGRVGRVHALAAGTGGAANSDFQFVGFDFDVHLLSFGQHRDGSRAGVNAALRLGSGNPLDAMDAAFEFQAAINVGAR